MAHFGLSYDHRTFRRSRAVGTRLLFICKGYLFAKNIVLLVYFFIFLFVTLSVDYLEFVLIRILNVVLNYFKRYFQFCAFFIQSLLYGLLGFVIKLVERQILLLFLSFGQVFLMRRLRNVIILNNYIFKFGCLWNCFRGSQGIFEWVFKIINFLILIRKASSMLTYLLISFTFILACIFKLNRILNFLRGIQPLVCINLRYKLVNYFLLFSLLILLLLIFFNILHLQFKLVDFLSHFLYQLLRQNLIRNGLFLLFVIFSVRALFL